LSIHSKSCTVLGLYCISRLLGLYFVLYTGVVYSVLMEEGERSEVVSECCQRREESVRVKLEGKLLALELKMEASVREMKEYADQLRECINLRDEKLIVKDQEIDERNRTIASMREEMNNDRAMIAELTSTVENLQVKLNGEVINKTKTSKKKIVTTRVNLEELFQTETFEKFFTIRLTNSSKREMSPFKFERDLIQQIEGPPIYISKGGKNTYLVEVRNKSQSEKIRSVSEVDGKNCVVRPYELYNDNKGLIYIYNSEIEDFQSFKNGLCNEYKFKDVVHAHWIKTKQNSQAYIVVTNEAALPTHIHVTGEYTLTRVHPYHDSPLHCKWCLTYGHSRKYCSAVSPKCRNCAGDHSSDSCSNADTIKCYNCGGEHRAGHHTCPANQKEVKIAETQKNHKVTRQQAINIIEGKSESNIRENDQYHRYLLVTLDNNSLRKTCPFNIEAFFKTKYGILRENLRREKQGIIVKTSNRTETDSVTQLTSILGIPCQVALHQTYNQSKGLIYITEYDVQDEALFCQELSSRLNADEVRKANWIRCREANTSAFLVTFKNPHCPAYIQIPGESRQSKVYEYRPRALFCTNCLEYSHKDKRCTNPTRCSNCTEYHSQSTCRNLSVACLHCDQPHKTGDRRCARRLQEEEIVAIQYKEKLSWPMAKQKYLFLHPEHKQLFSRAITTVNMEVPRRPEPEEDHNDQRRPRMLAREDVEEQRRSTVYPPDAIEDVTQAKEPEKRTRNALDWSSDEETVVGPKKGRTNQATISPSSDPEDDDDESSETNEKIRREVQKIYDEFRADPTHQHNQ